MLYLQNIFWVLHVRVSQRKTPATASTAQAGMATEASLGTPTCVLKIGGLLAFFPGGRMYSKCHSKQVEGTQRKYYEVVPQQLSS